ncbi:MAG: hypothetical protein IPG64_15200 [Haliea sp.]|nr:hypothetical protein [Haliea sp.]
MFGKLALAVAGIFLRAPALPSPARHSRFLSSMIPAGRIPFVDEILLGLVAIVFAN